MKLNPIKLILAICVIAVTFTMCGEDDDSPDPNVFCDEGICASDNKAKNDCIDAFEECMENNPDANDDECVATALLMCENI